MVFVDDSVSACSRAWVDAEDSHGQRLGVSADSPPSQAGAESQTSVWHRLLFYRVIFTTRRMEVTWPNASVTATRATYRPGRL